MSSTIAIPSARGSKSNYGESSKAASSSSSSSSYSTSPQNPGMSTASPGQSAHRSYLHHRRPSLLSTSFCKDECTVINIGDPDGPPRLISYLSSSQGFVWNPEIFLPSYVDCDYVPLENRREPVHEIRLSDDEIKNMLPQ
ncbi:hypothetical protein BKA67DRAFT_268778 [Truncatella angustata]|uniref:Uncharacterized protein n=1 Tax=Truncatella angustata TaxID=152316 RepID=A0A9P8UL93_9PEZI|nr:uncharacterized protein BKA67DRAFT_268778 [Truncatella angustata]KAH6654037.1 hypothetical protein BKA67DRAFT_268778 [Truncatella angustata]KAH8202915.1 hypothetical protein TruAng_002968 [Truncatella angustata]